MFKITILGCGSPAPIVGRNTTSQFVETETSAILVDCGEGTQLQIQKFGLKLNKIDHILISHCHGDHYYGLFGLLQTLGSNNRTRDLNIHCPKWLKSMLENEYSPVKLSNLCYKINFNVLNEDSDLINYKPIKLTQIEELDVEAIQVLHRGGTCYAFKFTEKRKPRNINKDKIKEYNLSIDQIKTIKQGEESIEVNGELLSSEKLLLPEKHRNSYIFASDELPDVEILKSFTNPECDVLYHDCTYDKSLATYATEAGHSTSMGAVAVAAVLGVDKLILGHFSTRYKDDVQLLVNEAKSEFTNTEAAFDGMVLELNYE